MLLVVVNGNVTITASAVRITCEIDISGVSNATISGLDNIYYYKNDIFRGKLIPNKQYVLPQSISLDGDSTLKSYDQVTGEFEILLNTECFIRAAGLYSPVPVTITSNLTHCSLSQSKTYNVYDFYNETITADKNYLLPKNIEVEGLKEWVYDPQIGVIIGSEITGDIQITAICSVDQSKIATLKFNGTECCCSEVGEMYIEDNFYIKITPNKNYKLPDAITVTGLADGYTYNKTTGDVSGVINANSIEISCVAEEIVDIVSFTFTGIHCLTTCLSQYEENTEISLKISPEFAYELPNSYTSVTGLENISYNKKTGEFTATIVGNATLVIEATKITTSYSYSVNAYNCTDNPSGVATYGSKVEVTVVPYTAYTLPLQLTSTSGCKDVEYDSKTGKISFVVLGTVLIELTAVYTPKEYSFSLTGSHVRCSAPVVLYEGSKFGFTLIPDDGYKLPDEISVTGLDNMKYESSSGFVGGNVVGNVSIDCDCVFDISDYAQLILHCTNCSVINAPDYVEKGKYLLLNVDCDFGYSLTTDSVVALCGVDELFISPDLFIFSSDKSDIIEINVVAVEKTDPININALHCSTIVTGGNTVNSVGLIRFNTDEGYILPEIDDISYEGIEILTYNTDTQILTYRRTADEPSLSITAIEGEKNYNSTIAPEDAYALIYVDGVYQRLINGFINTTMICVRNFDLLTGEDINTTNDVLLLKQVPNYFSYNSESLNFYTVLENMYQNPYEGTIYIEDGESWKAYVANNNIDLHYQYIVKLLDEPIKGMIENSIQYNEISRSYAVSYNDLPYTLYFKDGKLIAYLFELMGFFTYAEFSDYGTTIVELPEFPQVYSAHVTTDNNSHINGYDSVFRKYLIGETFEIKFSCYGGYSLNSDIEVSGLEDWTFDPSTGILTGTVTGEIYISVGSHVKK